MRRLIVGMVVAAATALVPAWGLAGNQEVAEQIAARLRDSGQLHGYKIGVKVQEGTAWLKGQVRSQEQLDAALRIASQTPGVSRVENSLSVAGETAPTAPEGRLQQALGAFAPDQLSRWMPPGLRSSPQVSTDSVGQADRLASSFSPTPVQQVGVSALQQQPTLAPAPATMVPAAPVAAPLQAPAAMAPVATMPAPAAAPVQGMPAPMMGVPGAPLPIGQPCPMPGVNGGALAGMPAARYDQPALPAYAWPGYAAHPNYAGVTYPRQYSPTAWPYIGPFYPYPQVPMGWRKVSLEWHDGWWNLDFDDGARTGPLSGLFRSWR